MRRSIRVGYSVVLLTLAVCAGAGSPMAQSLPEGLAGPKSEVVATGSWTTVTHPDPPKPKFDHWQAKIILAKPAFRHLRQATATGAVEPLHALHGAIVDLSNHVMRGLASFYGTSAGTRTATGEAFDPNGLTAAHRTLPFGTRVRVTRVDNGDSVIVRINDRGPFKPGRVIDLSEKAAEHLRMTDKGLAAVKLEVVDSQNPPHVETVAQTVAQRSDRR